MDDLNAQQIVLLTLLVSFVTSIATGITTVSLLEQAPEPVTQTINRVVERTVERVVETDENSGEPQEKIVETIIVKEEDLTIEAVEKNSNSIVRLYQIVGEQEQFVSIGVIVDSSGQILASSDGLSMEGKFLGRYPDSSEYAMEVSSIDSDYSILNIAPDQNSPGNFRKISTGNSQNLKLGQSVIALSGQNSNAVTTGIVTSLETSDGVIGEDIATSTPATQEIDIINTSVNSDKVILGSILLNLQGELVGFKSDSETSFNSFTPSSKIISYLESQSAEITE